MLNYPENNCLFCDMPWKNNRVRYEDDPPCPCAALPKKAKIVACRVIGGFTAAVEENGTLYGVDCESGATEFRYPLGKKVEKGTLAADVLLRALYLSAQDEVLAVSLEDGRLLWSKTLTGKAASPMLFELQDGQGEPVPLLGVGDASGAFTVLHRQDGSLLWHSHLAGAVHGVAAARDGRIYIVAGGYAVALDAANGDSIWISPANGEEGLLDGECYRVGGECHSIVDGQIIRA